RDAPRAPGTAPATNAPAAAAAVLGLGAPAQGDLPSKKGGSSAPERGQLPCLGLQAATCRPRRPEANGRTTARNPEKLPFPRVTLSRRRFSDAARTCRQHTRPRRPARRGMRGLPEEASTRRQRSSPIQAPPQARATARTALLSRRSLGSRVAAQDALPSRRRRASSVAAQEPRPSRRSRDATLTLGPDPSAAAGESHGDRHERDREQHGDGGRESEQDDEDGHGEQRREGRLEHG